MAAQTQENNNNAKGVAESTTQEPADAVAVGANNNNKARTRNCTGRKGHVASRYLRPKMDSCHDHCKTGAIDEPAVLKRPARRLGVRKVLVKKIKVKRIAEPVERNKTVKPMPKPCPDPKMRAPDEPVNRKSDQKEPKLPKKNAKAKPSSSSITNGQKNKNETKNNKKTGIVDKSPENNKPESPPKDEEVTEKDELKQFLAEKIAELTLEEAENEEMESVYPTVETESPLEDEHDMTKTKLNQLIDDKITEKTFHEAEDAELDPVPLTIETNKSPLKDEDSIEKAKLKQLVAEKITKKTLQEAENAELETVESPPTEITESSSDKQVKEEHENANNEVNGESKAKFMKGKAVKAESEDDPRRLKIGKGKIPEDNDEGPTKLKFRRGTILDVEEDEGPTKLNFRKGKVLEDDVELDSPTKLNFKRGTILENNEDDDVKKESDTVTLKHQETQEKKEEELLNRVIEETASKLEVDRKHKVDALVGAFETVISLHDDAPTTPTAK